MSRDAGDEEPPPSSGRGAEEERPPASAPAAAPAPAPASASASAANKRVVAAQARHVTVKHPESNKPKPTARRAKPHQAELDIGKELSKCKVSICLEYSPFRFGVCYLALVRVDGI